jgi:lipoate-protein ligase A
MKTATLTRKIPGGKLVRLDLTYSDHIESAKITGDFFLHPEDTLETLVTVIQGTALPINPTALTAKLEQVLADNNAQLIGASPADLVAILQEALT